MGIVVCKFGGTSTASSDMFRQISDIIGRDSSRRYIVLSAPGACGSEEKVTDMLYRAWRARAAGRSAAAIASAVAERFHRISEGLGIPDIDGLVRREIEEGPVDEARIASRGEYLCARLFSEYSGIPMIDAGELIAFDTAGRLELKKTLRRFRHMRETCPRAIIPGFYGCDPGGRIVTLPRNGSDITGALAAAGVGADLYENWSDVPGLMTADPAVDPSAKLIPSITYRAMRALAACGARVLHPDSLAPVERAGIPTRLRCTMRPDEPGTLVSG